jgi:hypothetical protein
LSARALSYSASVTTRDLHGARQPFLSPRQAVVLGLLGFVLEVALITPWADDLADRNPTFHFTQHGLIFLGGLVMGWALRDLRLAAQYAGRV